MTRVNGGGQQLSWLPRCRSFHDLEEGGRAGGGVGWGGGDLRQRRMEGVLHRQCRCYSISLGRGCHTDNVGVTQTVEGGGVTPTV